MSTMTNYYLVIIQCRALAPMLRGRAHKRDVIVTWHTVLLPPVQLHHVLTAHLHQPVHQTQRNKPGKHTAEQRNIKTYSIFKLYLIKASKLNRIRHAHH